MNVTVEDVGPCRKLLRVEIEPQKVASTYGTVTDQVRRQANVPGFRPGKAPLPVVEKNFEKTITSEVKNQLIQESFKTAVKDNNLNVLGSPDVEEIEFGRAEGMKLAFTVEIAPTFELPEYKGLPVKLEERHVTDADVERALETLREQAAEFRTVSRPAADGDIAVVNYKGTCEGKPLTEFSPSAQGITEQQNFWIKIESQGFIPGFADQIKGAQAGDHRTVQVTFPADFVISQVAGKQGVYEVDVVEVKERALPELNDDFAKGFQAADLETLKKGVRHDLENELAYAKRRATNEQVLDELLRRTNFDLPDSLVNMETRQAVYNIVAQSQSRGMTKDYIDQHKDQIFGMAQKSGKERVRLSFILGRIAEQEKLKVTDQELTEYVAAMAQRQQVPFDKYVKSLSRDDLQRMANSVLNSKVTHFIAEQAKVELVPPASMPDAGQPS